MKRLQILSLLLLISLLYLPDVSMDHLFGQDSSNPSLHALKYRSIGPTRYSGRIVDFAVSHQDTYLFYVATASGGLWKTGNNGIRFTPVFDDQPVISIGDIAIDPKNQEILWVGTGESNNSRSCYWGDGIYKTLDGGKSWQNMGLKDSHHIGRIVVDHEDSNVVYVAAMGHLYSRNSIRGVYKTLDGGKSWKRVLRVYVRKRYIGIADLAMDPTNNQVLYACAYDRIRKPWTYRMGGLGSGIYKTEDGGKSWRKLKKGLPKGILGRIGIAIYRKNPDILYATIENGNKRGMSRMDREREVRYGISSKGMIGGEVYRSDNGGKLWRKISPDGKSIGGEPAYYYGQIVIDPNNDQVVHVLNDATWGSFDGGKSWLKRPFRFGGDDHALWINPKDSRHMLLGFDHGMGISYDGGKHWYHPDNLPLAQVYAVGADMKYPYRIACGLQDNGSQLGPSTKRDGSSIKLEDWRLVGGGDGMYNLFDPNSDLLYNESQFGNLKRRDLKSGESKYIRYSKDIQTLRFNWCAPLLISPHDSNVLYHGANLLLRSSYRGENWQVISPDLTTADRSKLVNGKGGDGNIQYCTITTIDESPIRQGVLWAGTDDGNVQLTRNGGKSWKKLNRNIPDKPDCWVSRVVASRHNLETAYVTFSAYRQDDFTPYVYKTEDFGESWRLIRSNLPDGPINVIREDPKNGELLFVGTDFSVFFTINGGKSWYPLKQNMPTQAVHDMLIHPRENDLVVATHGRGIFIMNITPLQQLTEAVMKKDFHVFEVRSKIRWKSGFQRNSSSANFHGESEKRGIQLYYWMRSQQESTVTLEVYRGNVLINRIEGKGEPGLNVIYWDLTERIRRTARQVTALKKKLEKYRRYGYDPDVDLEYIYSPVRPGEYVFVLKGFNRAFRQKGMVLKDNWHLK